jgi:hypothetical protein
MSKRVLFCICIMALLISSCTVGSRRVITEEREVSGFDRIDFSTVGELTITQGASESLTIEAESNVMRRITTEVRGGTLHINMRSSFPWVWNVVPTKPIRYDLTVRELSGLDLSGVGSIHATGIEANSLSLDITGAGKIVIRSLSADALEVEHTGVGQCELSGQVRSQEVILTGAGDYDAADLESERAEVTVTGVGKATLWVTEDLDVVLSGAGKVSYYGDPTVSQEVSGLGSVERLGNR